MLRFLIPHLRTSIGKNIGNYPKNTLGLRRRTPKIELNCIMELTELLKKIRSSFVIDDNVQFVAQPFVFDLGNDKLVLIDFLGTFALPEKYFEDVNVWTHEFIEKTILDKILELEKTSEPYICFDDRCVSIFHFLAGLTTGSGWDDENLTPDMLWERVLARA